ncbi:hypothetical protein GN958_ATG11246 [Phytophthora infestans]|uniref:Uncharacterized protein n=1 Tax=Phytophthora infestans TaxID=4787 RepID=A0A8S9UE58_PHYIN|nr:hypothetical protein GN958_ATG11246 [Phytophthora infestans]
MPSQLTSVNPRDLRKGILKPRRPQLAKFPALSQFEAAKREYRELFLANMVDDSTRSVLDKEDHETIINSGWKAIEEAAHPNKFSHLCQFCCGLAALFASTAFIESDFSVLKWKMSDRRTGLTSLALEGVFQAKQFDQLNKPHSAM